MAEPSQNGHPDSDAKKRLPTVEHDERGKFRKGNTLCRKGGRRPGTPNVLTAARRFAKSRGMSLSEALQNVLASAYDAAVSGDKDRMSGAKLFLERTVGPVLRDAVNVNMTQQQAQGALPQSTGPQPPKGKQLLEWAEKLRELAEEELAKEEGSDGETK